jgi:uncharacterized protein (TIGR02594 family)
MSDRTRTAIVSFLVILGYLAFGYLLLTGWIKPDVSGDVALTLTGGVFGVLTAGFCWALGYELGSSAGSRSKDALIAGQLPQVPVVPAPSPPVSVPQPFPTPKPIPEPATVRQTGITATVFGGASDPNTSAYDNHIINDTEMGVALPYRFPGTRPRVHVWGPKGDAVCDIVDVGPWNTHDPYWQTGGRPQAETGTDMGGRHTNLAGIDLTPAAARAVGIDGKGKVDWAFEGLSAPAALPIGVAGEPPWLTLARAEIGFHEIGDNRGIQKFVDEAGFGAEGQAWCSIYAASKVRKAGFSVEGVNAMARSWTTAPSVTKIDAPRLGAIAVFWRGSQSGTEGHVGFYVGNAVPGRINVLGGNEGDAIQIEPLPIAGSTMGLIGYYWPAAQTKLT